ncbi:glycosyltransferase [Synechococcus sp. AH-551-C10]|nr:glycosyltransferase [Synechococcus sp. AH-551-C10]MDB4659654.1 glycosyltransferase [Synechococcus sp. AH-551-C10]
MAIVAINALNSNQGGGKSIRDSYLRLLNTSLLSHKYFIIVPSHMGLEFVNNPNIEVLVLPFYWSNTLLAPLIYRFLLGRVLQRICADVVLNMGDLIVHTSAKQLYIFDWPYALDVHPKVWSDMNLLDRINRRFKLYLIKRDFNKPDIVIAQTNFIKNRLEVLYCLENVRVINNAVTLNSPDDDEQSNFSLSDGIKLFCPSVYYPHKNLEILIDLAELIKADESDYVIVTTIAPYSVSSRRLLRSIHDRGLQDIIINIGPVPLNSMCSLYKKCDALLMPTLLESFSIVYLEAMHYGLPVFTSDMWFARAVCGNAAQYFEPLDAVNILHSINAVMPHLTKKRHLVQLGNQRLASFPTWEQNFVTYQQYIHQLLASDVLMGPARSLRFSKK